MARRTFDRSTSGEGNVIDMKTGKPVERSRYISTPTGSSQKDIALR